MSPFLTKGMNMYSNAALFHKVMNLYSNVALSDKGDDYVFQCRPFLTKWWICISMSPFLIKWWIPMPSFLTKVMNLYSNVAFLTKVMNLYSNAALSDKVMNMYSNAAFSKRRFQSHAFHTQTQSSTYSCQTNCEEHASSLDHPFDRSGESANEAPLKKAMNINAFVWSVPQMLPGQGPMGKEWAMSRAGWRVSGGTIVHSPCGFWYMFVKQWITHLIFDLLGTWFTVSYVSGNPPGSIFFSCKKEEEEKSKYWEMLIIVCFGLFVFAFDCVVCRTAKPDYLCSFEFQFLRVQPRWFALYHWRAAKGSLVTWLPLLPHLPASFISCHRHTLLAQKWLASLPLTIHRWNNNMGYTHVCLNAETFWWWQCSVK